MYKTLQSGQVAKKKDAPCLGPNVSAGNGPRWRFRARHAAANFFAAKVQIWPLLSIHTLKSAMLVTKYVRNLMQI